MAMTFGSILFCAFLLQVPEVLPPAQPSAAPSTAPTTAPSKALDGVDVAQRIAQLSDENTAVRDAAQAALMRSEVDLSDVLAKARESCTDPDVQLRLDSLIVQATERAIVGATRITLKFDNAPLSDVLAELSKQSMANFSDVVQEFGNESPRVTLNVENVTFWAALAELQKAGNLNVFPQAENWRVMRNFGNPLFSPHAIESGAFLVQPIVANYSRSVGYARNMGSGENFSIQLQMLTEPKIRLAQANGTFQLIKAVDSNGNSLVGPNPMQAFNTGSGQGQIQIATQLAYPKNPGQTITEMSGLLRLNMARHVETVAIEDFSRQSKPVERIIDKLKIVIAAAEPDAVQPNWIAATFVVEAAGDQAALQRLLMAIRQARVTDQNGRPFHQNTFNNISFTPQRAEFKVTYMPQGNMPMTPPLRLTLEVPTSFREVEIPFTLRDLKMP